MIVWQIQKQIYRPKYWRCKIYNCNFFRKVISREIWSHTSRIYCIQTIEHKLQESLLSPIFNISFYNIQPLRRRISCWFLTTLLHICSVVPTSKASVLIVVILECEFRIFLILHQCLYGVSFLEVSCFTCSSHGKLRSSVQYAALRSRVEGCNQNGKLWGVQKRLAQVSKFSKWFKTSHNRAKRWTIGMHYFDTNWCYCDYKMFFPIALFRCTVIAKHSS